MAEFPNKLHDMLEDFQFVSDRNERIELLIETADRFQEVPPEIAKRPFPEENHVKRCESDAYVFSEDLPDGTLKYHFAVENPQGISAKAMAVILDETLSGEPLENVANVSCDIVLTVFGNDISMGKGQGLMGMVTKVAEVARKRLEPAQA